MASTFFGLTIAYTGLQAANSSINTTAHNISNINTDGYSRQQAQIEAAKALRTYAGFGTLGSGVNVNSINQIRDSYYDVKYRNNMANLGRYEVMHSYMTSIEDYLNEFAVESYKASYEDFMLSLEELKKTPQEEAARNGVVNSAKSFADYFNNLSKNFTNMQKDLNEEIKAKVNQVNTIAQNIAALNKQINQVEASSGTANDLRDKRNLLVDELSSIVNVTTRETEIGNGLTYYSVTINGQPLVDNYGYNTLKVESKSEKRNASDAEGLYDISWESGLSFNEYSTQLSGELKALIDLRDGCDDCYEKVKTDDNGDPYLDIELDIDYNTSYKGIPYYQAKINEFAQLFTSKVNEVFVSGKTIDGRDGIPLFTVKYEDSPMSASSISVNDELLKDQSKLATTTDPTKGESFGDLVDQLMAIGDEKVFNGGTGSYFLESIVATVAIDSEQAVKFRENYNNLKNTIHNQRLSIMGVDEDEEGMDLIKFQQAYNLNAKMMSVMNEIYNKLINETGV